MERKWFKASLTKAVLIAAAHILAVVVAVTGLWIMSYPVFREELFEGGAKDQYEDTNDFTARMMKYSYQVVWGLGQARIFETEGQFDPEKIIDIEAYNKNRTVTGENKSGLAYRLGDLIEWNSMIDVDAYQNLSTDNSIVVCRRADGTYQYYYYSRFRELIESGELRFILDAGSTDGGDFNASDILSLLEDGQYDEDYYKGALKSLQDRDGKVAYIDCWSYDGYYIQESGNEYHPVGYADLLELVNENPVWNGRLSEANSMLDAAVREIGSCLKEYENINDQIEEGDTNFTYIYADMKNGRVYSNKSAYAQFGDLQKNIKAMEETGKYVIVAPRLDEFDTNIVNTSASAWRDEIKLSGPEDKEFIFAACVDTSYPIQDVFYTEHQLFEKYGSGAKETAVLGIAAGILFIVCVIWLALIAGRNNEDAELHLIWFDRWKTEIAAGVIIGLWLLVVAIAGISSVGVTELVYQYEVFDGSDYVQNSIPYIIKGAVIAAYTCGMFLIGFLSLVRRAKAKTLWENSLIRATCIFAKRLFENMHSVWKVIVVFGAFVLLHWFMFFRIFYFSGVSFVFMLLVEGAAFVYLTYQAMGKEKIKQGIKKIAAGEINYKIYAGGMMGDQKEIAEAVNSIGDGLDAAVEKSIKSERLKTDLITNVSHDIKTPLTSIINYVELLKQENFQDPRLQRYIEILEAKAQRLKNLTEDVVEASKISSGNITLEFMNLNLTEMIQQTSGEFEEKFKARDLREVLTLPEEEALICADGRRTWRVLENIYNNAAKYAMEGSRIYGDLTVTEGAVIFSLKNISDQPLNISADELTERFIRGDISRSTEGSGLGLSIAKTLTEMQKGTFELYLDGDLFKVTVAFPRVRL
ncbi:HAMP domain-containing sensor histidine kinase [Lachnospiraceae bacterium 50-23]